MRTRDLIRAVTKWSGKTYMQCANALGMNRQKWYRRVGNGTMSVDEFLEVLKACGLELAIVKGKEVWIAKESHGSLIAESQGKRYSTAASRPLAHDNGIELYVDDDGGYFFADFQKRKVIATDASVAEAFVERYGT